MGQLRRAVVALLMAFGQFVVVLQAQAVSPLPLDEARQFVRDLGNRTTTLMARSAEMTDVELQAGVRELVQESMDLETIGRAVVGSAWDKATPLQQDEYRNLYARWTVQVYLKHLNSGKAGAITVTNTTRVLRSEDVLVEAYVTDDPSVEIGTRVRKKSDGSLRIIDFMVRGFSMLMTQQAEFASVIGRNGFDGLIGDLRTRVGLLRADLR